MFITGIVCNAIVIGQSTEIIQSVVKPFIVLIQVVYKLSNTWKTQPNDHPFSRIRILTSVLTHISGILRLLE